MHFLSVLPLALGVSSLLIPPQVDETTAHISELFSELSKSKVSDYFPLKCIDGCPVLRPASAKNGAAYFKPNSPESKLGVDITVTANGGKVLLNQQQIWPRPALPPTLLIKQILDDTSNFQEYGIDSSDSLPLVPVSSSIEYKEIKAVHHDGLLTIHPISVEIMAVRGQVVQAERLEIKVAETEPGVGQIYSIAILPYQSSPLIDSCTNIWCRVRGTLALKYEEWSKAVASKVRGWRKCGGRKGGHKMGHKGGHRGGHRGGHKPGHKTDGAPFKGGLNKFGPGATHRPHGNHHHHHRHSRGGFFAALFRAVRLVVPPIILGISLGMLTRIILSRFAPRVLYVLQSGRGEYVEVKQSDVEEGRDSVDGPPKYEEVYGDEVSEKEDEKK